LLSAFPGSYFDGISIGGVMFYSVSRSAKLGIYLKPLKKFTKLKKRGRKEKTRTGDKSYYYLYKIFTFVKA
jgi:hypothetical protein